MTYEPHDNLPEPEDNDQTIWRYIEFPQLMSILERKALWFTAANGFDDPYEGSFTMPDLEEAVDKALAMGWNIEEDKFMKLVQSALLNSDLIGRNRRFRRVKSRKSILTYGSRPPRLR